MLKGKFLEHFHVIILCCFIHSIVAKPSISEKSIMINKNTSIIQESRTKFDRRLTICTLVHISWQKIAKNNKTIFSTNYNHNFNVHHLM